MVIPGVQRDEGKEFVYKRASWADALKQRQEGVCRLWHWGFGFLSRENDVSKDPCYILVTMGWADPDLYPRH